MGISVTEMAFWLRSTGGSSRADILVALLHISCIVSSGVSKYFPFPSFHFLPFTHQIFVLLDIEEEERLKMYIKICHIPCGYNSRQPEAGP